MELSVFVLLLAGHLLADFVLQSDALVERKLDLRQRGDALQRHYWQVCLAHALWLLPLHPMIAILVAPFLAAAHFVIDGWKLRRQDKQGASLTLFLQDQGLHLLSLLLFTAFLSQMSPDALIQGWWGIETWGPWAVLASGLLLNGRFAGYLVGEFLARYRPQVEGEEPLSDDLLRAGRVIGVLERALLFIFLMQGAWSAAGLVVTAKSIVRFHDMERRSFAEYYLLGTLASFLFAVVSVMVCRFAWVQVQIVEFDAIHGLLTP